MKAVVLFSGGLDSMLALKLIQAQGIEAIPVRIATPFLKHEEVEWVKPIEVYLGEEYLKLVKRPKHGYGKHLNPCIDCRIEMYRVAKRIMEERGAEFVVTGEVLDQRPMSQNYQALKLMEREAGLEGLILRPLSAKVLEPTIVERKGLVKREMLYGIKGRSRRVQLELAKKFGLTEFKSPSGGCLLTDPSFSRRLKALMKHKPDFGIGDVELLKVGRHFMFEGWLVVGRNERENSRIEELAEEGDTLLSVEGYPGPTALLKGGGLELAARIVARYSDAPRGVPVTVSVKGRGRLTVIPMEDEELRKFMVL